MSSTNRVRGFRIRESRRHVISRRGVRRRRGRLRAPRRPLLVRVPIALGVCVALAGCGPFGDGAAGPAVPSPSGAAAEACRALHRALPERVIELVQVATEPASEYTAAWGDPAVELRCGVPEPDVLTPGGEDYNPTAEAVEVNGVSWLLEERSGGYRFTTTDRVAHVEVTVPDTYAPEVGLLTEFAGPVERAVPRAP